MSEQAPFVSLLLTDRIPKWHQFQHSHYFISSFDAAWGGSASPLSGWSCSGFFLWGSYTWLPRLWLLLVSGCANPAEPCPPPVLPTGMGKAEPASPLPRGAVRVHSTGTGRRVGSRGQLELLEPQSLPQMPEGRTLQPPPFPTQVVASLTQSWCHCHRGLQS